MLATLLTLFLSVQETHTADPAASAPGVPTRSEQAKQLYAAQRFREAARAYEALWTETGAPKYRFNAAVSREAAGFDAHAYLHLRGYLKLVNISDAERLQAEQRIAALEARAVAVEVHVEPVSAIASLRATLSQADREAVTAEGALLASMTEPPALTLFVDPGSWSLTVEADGYLPSQIPLEAVVGADRVKVSVLLQARSAALAVVPVRAQFGPVEALRRGVHVTLEGGPPGQAPRRDVLTLPTVTWNLAPGTWTLEASAEGFERRRQTFEASAPGSALTLQLTAASPRDIRAQRVLGAGVLGGGGGSALIGAALLAHAGSRVQPTRQDFLRECPAEQCDGGPGVLVANTSMFDRQADALRLYGAGATVLGLGIGMVAHGVSLRRGLTDRSVRIQAVTGASLLATGLLLGVASYAGPAGLSNFLSDDFTSLAPGPIHGRANLEWRIAASTIGWTLAGAGASLIVAPLVTRAILRKRTRATLSPVASPRQVGAALTMSF